ncbi:MAG TPA: hypothetical protein VGO50_14865 [Pyrinomonadaceae bacterium]|jgi:hypothetical protein|nr:hypothetical protein [Pyrinomonadaceae bacterium]
MLIAIQLPLTDVRPFIPDDTQRLASPLWSLPNPDLDFVRSFGVVKKRHLGGIDNWSNEEMFCRAAGALKLYPTIPLAGSLIAEKISPRQRCVFRRLMADGRFQGDGSTVLRVEVGFAYRGPRGAGTGLSAKEFLNLLQLVLGQTVNVRKDEAKTAGTLLEAGKPLARDYLQKSTSQKNKEALKTETWWVAAGTPLVIVEYEPSDDILELPKYLKNVQSETLAAAGISAAYMTVELHKKEVGVWLLGVDNLRTNRLLLRNLRLNLFRLHAELESIKQIFRLVAQKKIEIVKKTDATERLQRFFADAIKLLKKENRNGIPQSVFLDIAQQGQDMVTPGERTSLLTHLSDIRGNLLKNIADFIQPGEGTKGPVINIETYIDNSDRSVTVNDQKVINYGTMGDVNQVVADSISNSFNKVEKSGASDELKQKFKELNDQVAEMLKAMPAEKHEDVAKDLEVLTEEAASKEPRKKWYDLSAEGLIAAATAVGAAAAPVITTVKTILALLAV